MEHGSFWKVTLCMLFSQLLKGLGVANRSGLKFGPQGPSSQGLSRWHLLHSKGLCCPFACPKAPQDPF
jgi:hypothetical protein